jgi:predicted nuclease of restriction endonuclease-like (RecB) superfamily
MPTHKSVNSRNYSALVDNIGSLLEEARRTAFYSINEVMVKTYWEIGKKIVEFEQGGKERAKYGSNLLESLSSDLKKKFSRGFSIDNLEKMRKFYITFRNSETLSRKLSWSHYCAIMRLDNPLSRNFYLTECEKEGWSVRELNRQISSMIFERIALSKDKKGVLLLSKKGHAINGPDDLVKDPYILEFLSLPESSKYTETELEQKIIDNLEKFLLELGKGFTFAARQQRITLEDEHFYIDLVFYNRLLKCFVLIELKIGKLEHKDLGQLQMYVNYYNREIKSREENPAIGILLCADKKAAIVRYTLPEDNKNIFASEYKLYLPNRKELEEKIKRLLQN